MTDKTEESMLKQYPGMKGIHEIIEAHFAVDKLDVEVKPLEKPISLIRNFVNDHLNPEE
jgi:hypothetical protein